VGSEIYREEATTITFLNQFKSHLSFATTKYVAWEIWRKPITGHLQVAGDPILPSNDNYVRLLWKHFNFKLNCSVSYNLSEKGYNLYPIIKYS
jgi:hypothetical protein